MAPHGPLLLPRLWAVGRGSPNQNGIIRRRLGVPEGPVPVHE